MDKQALKQFLLDNEWVDAGGGCFTKSISKRYNKEGKKPESFTRDFRVKLLKIACRIELKSVGGAWLRWEGDFYAKIKVLDNGSVLVKSHNLERIAK